jgi:hypothetical protein
MREQLARDEALRAHMVLYVCAGDLTRDQDAELRWLAGFGKPLVLALNKIDRFDASERGALDRVLRERYADVTDARVVVSAGGTEAFERRLADGRIEQVRRERKPDIAALSTLLRATRRPAQRRGAGARNRGADRGRRTRRRCRRSRAKPVRTITAKYRAGPWSAQWRRMPERTSSCGACWRPH